MYGSPNGVVAPAMHVLQPSRDDKQFFSSNSLLGGGCVVSLKQCHSPKLDIPFLELNSKLYSHDNVYINKLKSICVDLEIGHEVPLHCPRSQYCSPEHSSFSPHLHVPLSHLSVFPVHCAFDPHLQMLLSQVSEVLRHWLLSLHSENDFMTC